MKVPPDESVVAKVLAMKDELEHSKENQELILTRTKLETRTAIMRLSLAVNGGFIAGLLIKYLF